MLPLNIDAGEWRSVLMKAVVGDAYLGDFDNALSVGLLWRFAGFTEEGSMIIAVNLDKSLGV